MLLFEEFPLADLQQLPLAFSALRLYFSSLGVPFLLAIERIRRLFQIFKTQLLAKARVAFNLTGNIYVNQNASFSDFHVTGGNPAGNASLTDPEFVLKRFVRVQSKVAR